MTIAAAAEIQARLLEDYVFGFVAFASASCSTVSAPTPYDNT